MAEERLFRELDGKYRLVAQLGEGGTARVWLAVARGPSGFNKLVVLKTIRKELLNEKAIVEMFLDEARLAARLNHPNIVQTNEVFEQAGHPVIVMEYLDGLPFSAVLEKQRDGSAMALAMLLRIISDALSGLNAAHELSDYDGSALEVVHRDVSPHNLFITFAGQVKVLDFGIAQLTTKHEESETGGVKGKLRYMAPEQISGERVDRRADIYSMGVILWEIAASRRMWKATIGDTEIMRRIQAGDVPQLADVAPDLDPDLVSIINKALAIAPGERYASATELQSDLDDYIASLGGALRNRDIGRALSKMFDDVRKDRAKTIEAQVARAEPLEEEDTPSGPLPELTSFSNTRRTSEHPVEKHPIPTAVLMIGFFVALVTFSVALIWPRQETSSSTLPPQQQPKPPPVTAPVPSLESDAPSTEDSNERSAKAAEKISLRITAFPRGAHLTLDEVRLESNPFNGEFDRDDNAEHILMIRASGYRPLKKRLTFDRDHELVLTLKRKPGSGPTPKSGATRVAPSPSPAPPNCKTPYYFDERGVKKYKKECL